MRYKFNEKAPSGHRQYFIACNVRELELLHGMACKLAADLPSNGPTARLHNVSRGMARTLGEAQKAANELGDTGKRVHNYPEDDMSVL